MNNTSGNYFDKVLIGIGSSRQQRGYGGEKVLGYLEREGLVMIDPEWDGCLTLTPKGWERYAMLTGQLDDED
jgi:hypothetical protein